MPGIFISYRREDGSSAAGRLYDRLVLRFGKGQVFMDVDTLSPGEKFEEVIDRTLSACDALVVLIGRNWLSTTDPHGHRRLDDPNDWIRLEVATALRRDILVVPVLVEDAAMPRPDELPEAIAPLAKRNALEISHSRFHEDVDRLERSLEEARKAVPVSSDKSKAFWSTLPGIITIIAAAVSVLGTLLFLLEGQFGLLSRIMGLNDPWLIYYVGGVPAIILLVWLPLRSCQGEDQRDIVKTVFIFVGLLATIAVIWRSVEVSAGQPTDLFGRHSYIPYFVLLTIGIIGILGLILKYTGTKPDSNRRVILKYFVFLCVYLLVCRVVWEWIDTSARSKMPQPQVGNVVQ